MDGLYVDWLSTDGDLSAFSTPIVNGQSSVILYSGVAPGDFSVGVSINGYSDFTEIEFTQGNNVSAQLELSAIVNEASDGTVSVETLQGFESYSYVTSTDLVVYGQPGQMLTVKPGSMHAPNGRITNNFQMSVLNPADEISNIPYISDDQGTLRMSAFGAVEIEVPDVNTGLGESYEGVGNSVRFNGGYFVSREVESLYRPNDLFVNLRFKPDAKRDNQILLNKINNDGSAYKLELFTSMLGEMFLRGTITTDIDTFIIESSAPLDEDQWYVAGIEYTQGQLTLGIDDERLSIDAQGAIIRGSDRLFIGSSGFRGYIDDVRFGSLASSDKVISMPNQTVQIDATGQGRIQVQAMGTNARSNQIIGFTVTSDSSFADASEGFKSYELKLYSPIMNSKEDFQDSPLMDSLFNLIGIDEAYAQTTGTCKTVRCRRMQSRNGVMVTEKSIWGSVRDAITKKLLGDEVVNAVKKTAQFIFELTSINDVWVILRSIYHLGTGQTNKIQGFELTFAVIGIGITIFAVVTTGGAALAPLKLALRSFKGFLLALWDDIGAAFLTKGVVVSTKYIWTNIKLFIDGNRTLARQQMADFALALGKVINNAGDLLRPFFSSVRNLSDLRHFIKLAKPGKCFLAPQGLAFSPYPSIQYNNLFGAPLFPSAYAQGSCSSPFKFIMGLRNVAKYGDKAQEVSDAVFQITKIKGLDNLDDLELEGLAEVAFQHLKRNRDGAAIGSRLQQGAKFFDHGDLRDGLRAMGKMSKVDPVIKGYEGFASKFATLQKYQNDPIGTIHAARTLEKVGVDNVISLERKMNSVFPDIDPISFSKTTNGKTTTVTRERRIDAHVKENTNIEFKGSSKSEGSYSLTGAAEIEFLNDAIYFARKNQKFEWQIAPQLDITKAQAKMKKLLGGDNFPQGIDERLLGYIENLPADDARAMIANLSTLLKKIDAGEIIKKSEYID